MENTVNKRMIMLIAAISSFITPFMGSSINIALPAVQKEFSLDAVTLNWVAAAYLLAAAMFLVPFGRLADIYGRKRIFLYGLIAYTATTLLCGISFTPAMLIVSRVLQGIGSAMIFGTSVAILTSVFGAGERGKALGMNVAVTYIGLSTGPVLGGLLTQHLGWRSIFLITIPLSMLDIALVLWALKLEWSEARDEKFDLPGSIIYGMALVSLMYGLSLLPSLWGAVLIAGGIAGIALFVLYEARIDSPVLNVAHFKNNKIFIFSTLAAFMNYSATFAAGYLMSLYLQYIKGMTPSQAGIILLIQPAVQAIFSPLAGRLSDRLEPGKVASIGMAFTSIGLFMLITLNNNTAVLAIIISLILVGFGIALFSSPNTNAIMGSVERKFYGLASGMVGTMRLTGQVFSMGIVMVAFAVIMGKAQLNPGLYPLFLQSTRVIFLINSILCFAGIFASLARGSMHDGTQKQNDGLL